MTMAPQNWATRHLGRLFFNFQLDTRLVSCLLLAAAALGAMSNAFGQNAPQQGTVPRALDRYILEAFQRSPLLERADFEVQAEMARLESLRARFYPTLSFQARASVSEGGRTIDFPAGDLLNPVYNALNAQAMQAGRPERFPNVDNQSIPLLRPTEQDTRLVVRGPIYEPALDQQVLAQQSLIGAQQAQRLMVRDQLIRDLRSAYWQLAQAKAGIQILRASAQALIENERINQRLYKAGSVTLDAPKRAEAERRDIEIALAQAQSQADVAAEFFNLLRNANPDAPIELPSPENTPEEIEALVASLQPSDKPGAAAPELVQLEEGLAAQRAQIAAAQSSFKPSVGYSLEGGYQGRDYSTGPNTGFATASVVLSWTLADAGVRKGEVNRASAQAAALRAQADDVRRQLLLAKNRAKKNLLVSLDSLQARRAQVAAADETLRIVSRKRDAGEATPIEFITAEQAATRARLGLANAAYQARIDHAVWQYHNRNIPGLQANAGVTP